VRIVTALLRAISDQAVGWAIALCIVSAYIVAARVEGPTEVDTARLTAQVSNARAAEHAAMKGPR
jgi:hypothetical protein